MSSVSFDNVSISNDWIYMLGLKKRLEILVFHHRRPEAVHLWNLNKVDIVQVVP